MDVWCIIAWVIITTLVIGISISLYISTQRSKQLFLKPKNFDVYLINMKDNTERLQHFMSQYQRSDLAIKKIHRYEAVNGKTVDIKPPLTSEKAYKEILQMEKDGFRTKHYQLTRGAIGCYLSHLNVYKLFLQEGRDYLLLFEDDVLIMPHILRDLNASIAAIPKDWDVLLLGCVCLSCTKHAIYSKIKHFFLTHAMLVSREGAKKLVSYLDGRPIEKQIDSVMSGMCEKGIITIYCLNKPLAKQNNTFQTTIQMPLKHVTGINPYDRD